MNAKTLRQIPHISSWELPMEEGNAAFKSEDYRLAVYCYTAVIKASHLNVPKVTILIQKYDSWNHFCFLPLIHLFIDKARALLNRSLTHFKMELYGDSHIDACEALKYTDVNKEKAYYRKAKSEYAMRKFETSLQTFGECLAVNPHNKEALDGLNQSKQRVLESKTGAYNFEHLVTRQDILRFDVADFKSDLIRISEMPNKGKGVIAVKNIKKGTFLVGSKALAIMYESENDGRSRPIHSEYFYMHGTKSLTPCSIVTAQALEGNPDMANEFYQLFSGI